MSWLGDLLTGRPVDAAEELRREVRRTPGGEICWNGDGGFDVSKGVGETRKTEHFHSYIEALAFVREGKKQ